MLICTMLVQTKLSIIRFYESVLGFSLFSVGRDHAGADGVYGAHEAPDLVNCNRSEFKIQDHNARAAPFIVKIANDFY